MGAGNIKAVFALWPQLPHAAFRALTYMALTSMDESKPPTFWGGREALALALGIIVPPSTSRDKHDQQLRRAAFARVDRAIAELIEEGAIELLSGGHRGANATYSLNLSGGRKDHAHRGAISAAHPPERTTVTVTKDHGHRDERTTVTVTKDHGHRGPEEERRKSRTQLRNMGVEVDTDLTVPRATAPRRNQAQSLPKKCAHGLHNRIRKDGTQSCRWCRNESGSLIAEIAGDNP